MPNGIRLVAAIFTLILVSSCGGDEAGSGGSGPAKLLGACPDKGKPTIGVSTPVAIGLFKSYVEVIESQARQAGIQVVSSVANLDPNKQISDVDSMVQQGVDALIVAPINPPALKPAIDRAREAGIKLIGIDIATASLSGYETSITSANVSASEAAAAYLAELLEEGGRPKTITIMDGPNFAGRPLIERAEGFTAGAGNAGLTIVDRQTNLKITPDGAAAIANTWRQRFPNLGGILVFNDPSAVGVISAIRKGFQPLVVSINGEVPAIEAIRAGRLAATYDLLPVLHGHAMAYAADQAFCGKDLPEEILIDPARVDQSNVSRWTPHADQLQLPFTIEFEQRSGKTFLKVPEGFPFRAGS